MGNVKSKFPASRKSRRPEASEEIPFGLRIASDCPPPQDDPLEMQNFKIPGRNIVQDISFTSMADALTFASIRTKKRDGRTWSAAGVSSLSPASSTSPRACLRRRVGIPAKNN